MELEVSGKLMGTDGSSDTWARTFLQDEWCHLALLGSALSGFQPFPVRGSEVQQKSTAVEQPALKSLSSLEDEQTCCSHIANRST